MTVHKIGEYSYHIDGKLITQLDFVKRCLKDNWDMLFIICSGGKPGPGKTTLGTQLCSYIDPVFSINECVFSAKDLIKKGLNMNRKPFSIQYDEAKESLNKKRQMTEQFHNIEMFFDECRQFNPFMVLCTPNLFDLPKPLVVNRASAVIDVYYNKDPKTNRRVRGMYRFFGDRSSKHLYLKGVKNENYYAATPDFTGRFTNTMTIPRQEYNTKKLEAARSRFAKQDDPEKRHFVKLIRLISNLKHNEGLSAESIGAYAGITPRYVRMLLKKYEDMQK